MSNSLQIYSIHPMPVLPFGNLQLVFLLSRSNLPKLLLGYAPHKSFHPPKNFKNTLSVKLLLVRRSNESLDLNHAIRIQMVTHSLVNLSQYSIQELVTLIFAKVEDLVDVSALYQL